MPEVKKRKTRIYEPWGYREEDNYESVAGAFENLLEKFFTSVKYDKENNKIIFGNKDNEDIATLDLSGLTPSGGTFYEFNGGLQENAGTVSVLVDPESEDYLSVSDNGVKVSGIDAAIDNAVTVEKNRAESAENTLNERINAEESERTEADNQILEAIAQETSARTESDNQILDSIAQEISARTDADNQILEDIAQETVRATSAETGLQAAIAAEEERAKAKEDELDERISEIASGSSELLEELIEKLGYKDNDTLVTTNEHEVAFGEYNISNTSEEASGQTIFSIGNGTSDANRSNAVDVRKNGDVYLLIEGEMMNINLLLGQIAHEVYD